MRGGVVRGEGRSCKGSGEELERRCNMCTCEV